MASMVTTRPNHYALLGIAPNASSDEIRAAFAREIARPRAFGGLVELSVAFEALRDPARRRAYDDMLGLNPVKAPPPPLPDKYSLSLPTLHLAPPPRAPEPAAEPRIASFIASSLREPAALPEPLPAPRHDPPPALAARATTAPERPAVALPYVEEDDEQPAIDLKRPAVVVGGLIAAVALVGAWAGVTAGNEVGSQPPERAVTVTLPKAKAVPATPVEEVGTIIPRREARPVVAARPAKPLRPTPPPTALAGLATKSLAAEPSAGDPLAPAAEDLSTPVAASLPLSNATIARTIGRIGYACGAVASTEAIGGGAFKVTCTSGHAYRAAPVHGRYRFKRL